MAGYVVLCVMGRPQGFEPTSVGLRKAASTIIEESNAGRGRCLNKFDPDVQRVLNEVRDPQLQRDLVDSLRR